MAIARILVPTDFSDSSVAALRYAYDLAQQLGAQVTVLHVWEVTYLWPSAEDMMLTMPASAPMTVAEYVKTRASEELTRLVGASPLPPGQVTAQLEMGDPVRQICGAAVVGRHDLIVMGTHGRRGLSRVLMGSVAENVVRRSPVPVLTVRAPEPAAEAQKDEPKAAMLREMT